MSPPPADGPAQPSAAQPGATRACLGPNPRSVSARTHRRPCCRLASSAPLLRPAAISTAPRRSPTPLSRPPVRSARSRPRPGVVRRRRRRHGRHRPTPSLEHELVTRDKRRKISSPAGDLRTKYQHTHSKEARDRCSLRITRQAIWCGGPSRARTSRAPRPSRSLRSRATRARGGGGRRRGATEAPIPLATPKMPQLRESLRNDLVPSPLPPLPTLWAPPLAPRGLPLLPLSIAPPAAPRRQHRPTARGRRRRGDRSHRHRSGRPGEERHVWGGRGGFAGEVVCVQLRQLLATNLPLDQRCGLTHLAQPTRAASPRRVHPSAQAAAARRRRRA